MVINTLTRVSHKRSLLKKLVVHRASTLSEIELKKSMVRKSAPPTGKIVALRGLSSEIHSRIWGSNTRRLWLHLVHQEAPKSTVAENFRAVHVSLYWRAFLEMMVLFSSRTHAAKGTKAGSVTVVLQFIISQQTPLTWTPKKIHESQIFLMKDRKHVLDLGRKFSEKILYNFLHHKKKCRFSLGFIGFVSTLWTLPTEMAMFLPTRSFLNVKPWKWVTHRVQCWNLLLLSYHHHFILYILPPKTYSWKFLTIVMIATFSLLLNKISFHPWLNA